MIKLNGKLKTKVIHGRNGDFTVGTLLTDIGEFSVKDSLLDQYPEGEYNGEFSVSKIFPSSYTWGGAVRVEVRAILESVSIITSEEKPMPTETVPDPLVENNQPAAPVQSQQSAQASNKKPVIVKSKAEQKSVTTDSSVNLAIFGEIKVSNQPGDEVKLDPTIDRQLFRQQRDALREMGYHFDAKLQVWLK